MASPVAYHWSAREPVQAQWMLELVRLVRGLPEITLQASDGPNPQVVLGDGVHEPVAFAFPRRRGAGTVSLASGAKLIVISLRVAVRLRLDLADAGGAAFAAKDPRSWLARIAFGQDAWAIETLAHEVGFLPKRVRLDAIAAPLGQPRRGRVFF